MHTHAHTHTHAHIPTHAHTHMHTHAHAHAHAHTRMHMRTHTCTHTCTLAHARTHRGGKIMQMSFGEVWRKLLLVLLMQKCPGKRCRAVVSTLGQDPPGEPGASSPTTSQSERGGDPGCGRRGAALSNADLLPCRVLDCWSPREYRCLSNAPLGSTWRRGQEIKGSLASAAVSSTPLVCSALPVMLHFTGKTGGPNKEQL